MAVSRSMRGCLAVAAFVLAAPVGRASAQNAAPAVPKPPAIEVKCDRGDGLYAAGETIRFSAAYVRDGAPVAGKALKYRIAGDGGLSLAGDFTSGEAPYVIETKSGAPGIVVCTVTGADDAGKPLAGAWGAGVDVSKIEPGMPLPADLDEFWKKTRAELDAVPVKELERKDVPIPAYVPEATRKYFVDKKVRLYDVKVSCAGGMPVSGYLALPEKMEKGACPATLTFIGAPGHNALVYVPLSTAAAGGIGLVINAHGHENGRDEAYLAEFRKTMGPWFGDDPSKVYVRGMALRAMRALQYLKSMPEWNGRDLSVGGGSMGGGQALLAAALDPDVSFCDATAPTFCDWAGGLKRQRAGWPVGPAGLTKPEQIAAAAYCDMANLCRYITAPTIIRTGFLDTLCASTGHFAVYNRMTCPKLILHNPGAGHSAQLANPAEDTKKIQAFQKEQKALLEKRVAGRRAAGAK